MRLGFCPDVCAVWYGGGGGLAATYAVSVSSYGRNINGGIGNGSYGYHSGNGSGCYDSDGNGGSYGNGSDGGYHGNGGGDYGGGGGYGGGDGSYGNSVSLQTIS